MRVIQARKFKTLYRKTKKRKTNLKRQKRLKAMKPKVRRIQVQSINFVIATVKFKRIRPNAAKSMNRKIQVKPLN